MTFKYQLRLWHEALLYMSDTFTIFVKLTIHLAIFLYLNFVAANHAKHYHCDNPTVLCTFFLKYVEIIIDHVVIILLVEFNDRECGITVIYMYM